jgi:hypothetical protein
MRHSPPRPIRAAASLALALIVLAGCASAPAGTAQQPAPSTTAIAQEPATVAASPIPPTAVPATPTLAEPTASPAPASPTAAAPTAEEATPAATAQATPAGEAADFAPIVDLNGSRLLGGIEGTRWLTTEVAAPFVKGGETYRIVSGGQVTVSEQGSALKRGEVPCDWTYDITITNEPSQPQEVPISAERGALAVGGSWELFPRQPQELGTSMQVYRDAVATELIARGITTPNVQIGRIVRADLDGDGVDEVLLNATYYRSQAEADYLSPDAAAGDYSLVLLRTVVDGKVVTVPVAESYYVKDEEFVAPLEHVLAEVIDLNGDGRLDVVVRSSYYEGSYVTVYEITGTTVSAVLSEGCGV